MHQCLLSSQADTITILSKTWHHNVMNISHKSFGNWDGGCPWLEGWGWPLVGSLEGCPWVGFLAKAVVSLYVIVWRVLLDSASPFCGHTFFFLLSLVSAFCPLSQNKLLKKLWYYKSLVAL